MTTVLGIGFSNGQWEHFFCTLMFSLQGENLPSLFEEARWLGQAHWSQALWTNTKQTAMVYLRCAYKISSPLPYTITATGLDCIMSETSVYPSGGNYSVFIYLDATWQSCSLVGRESNRANSLWIYYWVSKMSMWKRKSLTSRSQHFNKNGGADNGENYLQMLNYY